MTTTLFEIEVNEFCDGFPVINSEVAGKLFSTFNSGDSYGLLRDLFASTLVIEEIRLTDMEDVGEDFRALAIKEKSVQYTVSEVPAKFTYSFVGTPVLTEDFLRKFSGFFNNGHTSEISKLLSELQDMYKGVVQRRVSDEQLKYIVELLLMVHDAVYSRDFEFFWTIPIGKYVSDDMISEVFDQELLSVVKISEGSSTNAEVAEAENKPDVIFVNDLVTDNIIELLVFARKCSKNGLFHDLLLLHRFVMFFVSSFKQVLEVEGYEYDVKSAAWQKRGIHQSLASAAVDSSFFHDNVFRYELSEFDQRGIPFMTADFLKYMYEFFGGGHSAELRKVLERAVVNTAKFEKSASSKNRKKFSRSPVYFTYGFSPLHDDGNKYHLDKDFLYHLGMFFRRGNTAVSSQLFYDLENVVR